MNILHFSLACKFEEDCVIVMRRLFYTSLHVAEISPKPFFFPKIETLL